MQFKKFAYLTDGKQNEDNDLKTEARKLNKKYEPVTFSNADTKKQLLARSRYLLFKSRE